MARDDWPYAAIAHRPTQQHEYELRLRDSAGGRSPIPLLVVVTCPVCGGADMVRPGAEPPAEAPSPGWTLARRSWPWLAGVAGLLMCCCGVPYLLPSGAAGSARPLTPAPVLGFFLARTIVAGPLVGEGPGTRARRGGYCGRCAPPGRASRSRL